MSNSDVRTIALSLGVEVPTEEESVEQAHLNTSAEMEVADQLAREEHWEQQDLDNAFVSDEDTLHNVMNDLNSVGTGSAAGAGSADASATSTAPAGEAEASDSAADEARYDSIISTFCSITGSDPTSARHFLEVCF